MITLHIIAEQLGEHMTTTYHAEMDATSTAPEKEHIDLATNAIQKMIADKKGTGEFIERKGSDDINKGNVWKVVTPSETLEVPPEIMEKAQDILWDYFVTHHDLHLLGLELNDIIVAVRQLKE